MQKDPVNEFFQRRTLRTRLVLARQLAQDAIRYFHEHPENSLAFFAVQSALGAEQRAEREYFGLLSPN